MYTAWKKWNLIFIRLAVKMNKDEYWWLLGIWAHLSCCQISVPLAWDWWAAGSPGVGFSAWPVTPWLWGIQGEFLLLAQAVASFGAHILLLTAYGIHLVLSRPGAVAPSSWRFSRGHCCHACLPFYSHLTMLRVSKSVYSHKEGDILIAIHFTKRFTTVHF